MRAAERHDPAGPGGARVVAGSSRDPARDRTAGTARDSTADPARDSTADPARDSTADPARDSTAGAAPDPVLDLAAGDLLAARYRLDVPLAVRAGSGPAYAVWRAVDEVLARPVLVKVLGAGGDRGSGPFLAAAVRCSAVTGGGLARVYDAAREQRAAGEVAYVVSEWLEARPLAELLRDGPLPPDDAVAVVRTVARALLVAHRGGLRHGRVHPGNVLLGADGRVRLADTAVAAAVHAQPQPPDAVAGDTRDLVVLLFALLTGRWPQQATDQPSGGLPPAPSGPAQRHPRLVRAGVPGPLDALVAAALQPGAAGPATPDALESALDACLLAGQPAGAAPAPAGSGAGWAGRAAPGTRDAQRPERRRHRLAGALAALGLLAVSGGTAGVLLGGRTPARSPAPALQALGPAPAATSATSAAPGAVLRLTPGMVQDFDPPPGDGHESPRQVDAVLDGDGTTAWLTDRYRTAALGGLKPGVGLLVDLGHPQRVDQVTVGLTVPGATLELRAADVRGNAAADFRRVAVVATAGVRTRLGTGGVSSRYWLVWLTRLPAVDGGFREGVSGLALR